MIDIQKLSFYFLLFIAFLVVPYIAYSTSSLSLNKQIVVYINFNLPSTQKRMFVVKQGKIVFSTYVAHGSGSGRGIYAKTFSNQPNSRASSLGTYKTGVVYKGHNGPSRYLYGLSSTNSNVFRRQIVIHGASYIGNGKIGNSWGCFAVPFKDLNTVLYYTQPGTTIIAYK
jgi:L,D-transpeptidase catalytic domain